MSIMIGICFTVSNPDPMKMVFTFLCKKDFFHFSRVNISFLLVFHIQMLAPADYIIVLLKYEMIAMKVT